MLVLRSLSRPLILLGQIMAFITIAIIGIVYLNQILPIKFLGSDLEKQLTDIKEYAVIFTLMVCGLSFACKTSLLIFIPFCILAICALACYSIFLFT